MATGRRDASVMQRLSSCTRRPYNFNVDSRFRGNDAPGAAPNPTNQDDHAL